MERLSPNFSRNRMNTPILRWAVFHRLNEEHMTTSAQNLSSSPLLNDNDFVALNSVESLFAWLLQDPVMNQYKPKLGGNGEQSIYLSKDGFTKVILGKESFHSFDRLQSYVAAHKLPYGAIICAGTEDQLQDLPLQAVQSGALTLGLPATAAGIRAS